MRGLPHVTRPALSYVTGRGLSHVTGPRSSQATGPGLSRVTGPKLSRVTGPGLSHVLRTGLSHVTGSGLSHVQPRQFQGLAGGHGTRFQKQLGPPGMQNGFSKAAPPARDAEIDFESCLANSGAHLRVRSAFSNSALLAPGPRRGHGTCFRRQPRHHQSPTTPERGFERSPVRLEARNVFSNAILLITEPCRGARHVFSNAVLPVPRFQ